MQKIALSRFSPYREKSLIKSFLIMKLSAILLIAGCLQASAKGYSQKITLSVTNAPAEYVFREIEKQTGYGFIYAKEQLAKLKPVDLDVQNTDLTTVLNMVFKEQVLTYTISGNNIAIEEKQVSKKEEMSFEPPPPPPINIKGAVIDEKGKPLEGATILVKGTKNGTKSHADGNFSIDAEPNSTLVISYVGFETAEVKIGNRSTILVQLKLTVATSEQIVVIGYGTERKKDITGSVASVQLNEQEKTPVLGTEQLLEGRVSGVQVTQQHSEPGATFSIRIRGTNSINSSSEPLFVVDGYAGGSGDINPSDILSIDILKDASATAIYGSRGANGVVIITTKRGSTGGSKVTVDAYTGMQRIVREYKMMDAKQYAAYNNRVFQENNDLYGTSNPLPYTQAQINSLGKGTNWQDEILRMAPISNFSVGFNGGGTDSKHYLSFNLFEQNGVIIGSDYKKATVRYNMDQNIGTKIKIGISTQLGYSMQKAIPVNINNGTSVLNNAVRFNPGVPVKDSTGEYTVSNEPVGVVAPLGNPVAWAREVTDNSYGLNVFVNAFAEYEIIKSLKFRSSFGVNYATGGQEQFIPTDIYLYQNVGSASQSSSRYYNWLNENTLTYNKKFADIHLINITAGLTYQHWYNKGFNASITNLTTNLLGTSNFNVGTPGVSGAYFDENVLASYFGRINYQLKDKYLFTFTMRADGSSRFGDKNKWGYFPSGAIAWHLSEEKFIKNIRTISDLKLRVSYGVTGNQEIGSYNALSQYSSNQYALGSTPVRVVGTSPANIANPDLKWESTASYDAGLDIGLWANRLLITADYYSKKTSDLLLNVNIPATSGYASILQNIGSVSNKGFEFSATSLNIDGKKVKWSTTFNFSINKNKVLSLGPNPQIFTGQLSDEVFHGNSITPSILKPGYPVGTFYGYVFDGIWQTQDQINKSGTTQSVFPGDPIYKDLNNDKVIDGNDRTVLGQASPKFIYGLTNNITVGRFNLNIFIHGVSGNKLINENLEDIENGLTTYNKLAYIGTESWHGAGTGNTLPRVSSILRNALGFTSDILQNGSFLRLKAVTLSYDLPLPKITSVFKSTNIYVTGQNLLTITKYTGYDPEVSSSLDPLALGTDYNAYPNYRTFLIGVKFRF